MENIQKGLNDIAKDFKKIDDDKITNAILASKVMLFIKVEHAWNGMSCHICSRGQHDTDDVVNGCDLEVPGANQHGYCALFIPSEGRVKTKREIVGMMEMHVQRWIRERSNFG